jgi:hypothetical protein
VTAKSIYRLLCDGPRCPATVVVEERSEAGAGWTRVDSTMHLNGWQPDQPIRGARGRVRKDPRTRSDVFAGGFALHLCPAHREVFDAHRPETQGGLPESRTGDRYVSIVCSCGWAKWSVRDLLVVHSRPEPHATPELAWFRHLPEELRWYAAREAVRA